MPQTRSLSASPLSCAQWLKIQRLEPVLLKALVAHARKGGGQMMLTVELAAGKFAVYQNTDEPHIGEHDALSVNVHIDLVLTDFTVQHDLADLAGNLAVSIVEKMA